MFRTPEEWQTRREQTLEATRNNPAAQEVLGRLGETSMLDTEFRRNRYRRRGDSSTTLNGNRILKIRGRRDLTGIGV